MYYDLRAKENYHTTSFLFWPTAEKTIDELKEENERLSQYTDRSKKAMENRKSILYTIYYSADSAI